MALLVLTCDDDEETEPPVEIEYPESDALTEERLMETVEALADPELAGRAPGTPGDEAARAIIEERFESLGLEPLGETFSQDFTASDGSETANVIAMVPGTDEDVGEEVIVVGAHHDHLPEDADGIYPGANDDASGVAVVLGLAEYFAENPPRRTIVFATFGAEELDLDGSKYFVENPEPGFGTEEIVFMLNLDMVGTYAGKGILNALNTYPDTPGRTALESLLPEEEADCDVEPGVQCRVGTNGLLVALGEEGADSDHLPFCEAGVPLTFFLTDKDECYHQTCDTADRVDGAGMELIAVVAAALLDELANGDLDLAGAQGVGCSE